MSIGKTLCQIAHLVLYGMIALAIPCNDSSVCLGQESDDAMAVVDESELAEWFGPDGTCDHKAFRRHLREAFPEIQVPVRRLFRVLDADGDKLLDASELGALRELLEQMGLGQPELPIDPGKDYVVLRSLRDGIDDLMVEGAIYHRHLECVKRDESIEQFDLNEVPLTCGLRLENADAPQASVEELMRATVILAGGEGDDFFTSGGVLVSSNGLVLTNYHVAEAFETGMTALTSGGACHRVAEFVAGNRLSDVALVRLEGNDFPFVGVATTPPEVGDDLVMIHHTENRFYTYDRGYLQRNPIIDGLPWMEVSLNFGPGGSGCGIFNRNHELVGLVSIVMLGDGPSLARLGHGLGEVNPEGDVDDSALLLDDSEDLGADGFELVVRHAVALPAIRSLFQSQKRP
ncbi:trypsin-like peptidase domain-containing protein [Aporhodopirellula aestuarii]|uniref:Trypsin-like peptidase domain-containing protein n=1 Tax=Aporhodopirellula aestuarii TaxID=2950107 RepID=A0ABT0TYT3_9BACT|nr:trypsin-like peptidase domain-containing protein [Aporhodopirellula aestuarii]MCM2369725.1 trypsin-like peptidase domain-containing protein [Aporhodopirellula aestuarii]